MKENTCHNALTFTCCAIY